MINHLKEIHHIVYLPPAPDSGESSHKVTLIEEPYLYADANLYVDTFNNPIQSVKVTVSNVGGGNAAGRADSYPASVWRVGEKRQESLHLPP